MVEEKGKRGDQPPGLRGGELLSPQTGPVRGENGDRRTSCEGEASF